MDAAAGHMRDLNRRYGINSRIYMLLRLSMKTGRDGDGAAAAADAPGQSFTTAVDSQTLNQSSQDEGDFIIRESTIAPGGSTDRHFHDGNLSVRSTKEHSPTTPPTARSAAYAP